MNIFIEKARASPVELLYRQYASHAYSLSLHLLGEVPAAEKATGTVFATLARLIHQRAIPTNIENVLIRITVDVALRHFGGSVRRSLVPAEVESDKRDGLQGLLDRQAFNGPALEAAIKGLLVDLRFAFVLHDTGRLSHEEIADVLGWTVGLSKESLFKARMELRRLLLNSVQLATVGGSPKHSRSGE